MLNQRQCVRIANLINSTRVATYLGCLLSKYGNALYVGESPLKVLFRNLSDEQLNYIFRVKIMKLLYKFRQMGNEVTLKVNITELFKIINIVDGYY